MEIPNSPTVYVRWSSPSRLFKRRDKEFFRNVAAIVFLLLVILLFAREFILILAVLSVAFLVYVFSTVPPEEVEHIITNLGVESAGHFYRWNELSEFWFEEQWDQILLVIVPLVGARVIMIVQKEVKIDHLRDVLSRFIAYREIPQKTAIDNAASWLSHKIPLEKPTS